MSMRAWGPAGLLATVLLALAVSGCGGGGGGEEGELQVSEIVRRTTEATAAVKSFHFRIEVEHSPPNRPGLTLTFADGDLVVPDKLRAKVAGTLSGFSLRSELVFAGGQHFLKDPLSGKWLKLDVKTNPVPFFDPSIGVLPVITGAKELVRKGSQSVGGVACYRLEGVVRARDVTPILGNKPTRRRVGLELWVGKEDLVVRRIRLLGRISDYEPRSIVRTVEISRLDEPVSIEPQAGAR